MMGTFNVQLEIGDPDGQRFETVEAMVDSGATFTFIPRSLLERLGVRPHDSITFEIADGSQMERDSGLTWIRLDGNQTISPVIFGDDNAITPLLGAVTLEIRTWHRPCELAPDSRLTLDGDACRGADCTAHRLLPQFERLAPDAR